ncbi:MAG: CHASE2 domain-containing protein [Saprospiraceae bacterium]|nr:CHASE2 domain-containing protein [Saprospiraceae bacterium]
MRKFLKKIFKSRILHYDNFLSIIIIFILFFFVIKFVHIDFLDPLSDAFADVEFTDIIYSQFDKNDEYRQVVKGEPQTDTNIVIVNIGFLDRGGIATELNIINQYSPKVVGIDVKFEDEKDAFQDSMLMDALSKTKNLVLYGKGINYHADSNSFEFLETCHPKFAQYGYPGFTNLKTNQEGDNETENYMKVCRIFLPFAKDSLENKNIESFAVKICELYSPESLIKLKKRNSTFEYINYFGNIAYYDKKPRYKVIDIKDIFNDSLDGTIFRDKIVLMGFLGRNLDDKGGEDKFFTPLNPKYIGKTNPDMYGVVIHANTIGMILQGNYINKLPAWIGHIIGLIIVFLTFALFRYIYYFKKDWYDGLTKIIIIIESLLILFTIVMIFGKFDYKIQLPAFYFVLIVISADYLEVYFGFIKNIGAKFYFGGLKGKLH